MREVGVQFCDNEDIFYILDDGEYYLINGSDGYHKDDWLLADAVKDYKSAESKMKRFLSEWETWCG